MEEKRRTGLDMRLSQGFSSRIQLQNFRVVVMVAVGCILIPCILFIAMKPKFEPISILTMQSSSHISVHVPMAEENDKEPHRTGTVARVLPISSNDEEDKEIKSSSWLSKESDMKVSSPKKEENKLAEEGTVESNTNTAELETTKKEEDEEEKQRQNQTDEVKTVLESSFCDFSQDRSDTCSLHGDIRVLGHSSTITIASPSQSDQSSEGTPLTWKIRPYARKWESQLMDGIREFSVKRSPNAADAPRCTVNHTSPAVIFSTGGFVGNFFHDFTDLLIPLFATSRQFQGEVHFLVSNFSYGWISKYRAILSLLSDYNIINLDRDQEVHCFPRVHVGLISQKELGMEPSKTPNGYSISDFRDFLRSAYSLKRKSVPPLNGRKPKLLIILRKGSRSFMNRREVVSMGRRTGFKVVAAGPEEARNLTRFAKTVNTCDVMMGVHGAGLTNMLFMPTGAALAQIVPWGELHYPCFHAFGGPANEMGIKYLGV